MKKSYTTPFSTRVMLHLEGAMLDTSTKVKFDSETSVDADATLSNSFDWEKPIWDNEE